MSIASHASRRPRRIAADEAHAWARNLRLGNPYAKLVLSMLTLYVNGDGSCFVGVATLADDTELAENTVRRRLGFLEEVGAIARFPQWRDENGRLNGDGRGKRTTDDIRLLINSDPEAIEAKARNGTGDDGGSDADVSPAPGEGLNHPLSPAPREGLNTVSPSAALQQPSHCGVGLDSSEPEPEETPNPLSGGVCDPGETEKAKQANEAEESFKPFAEVYPADISDYPKAIAVWSALTQAERADAIRGARGYRAFMEAERRRGSKRAVKDAHRWLRDKLWLGYLDTARKIESAAAMKSSTSAEPEGRAWLALHSAVGAVMPYGFNREPTDKFQIPASIPPAVMAFADLVNVRGVPDKRSWLIAEFGTEQAAAWSRFFTDTIKRMPRIENHDGRRGFLVPWEWPPRKDGSTAPPANIGVSESELADFK